MFIFFFFNDTATTEIYTLSLHDALPIYLLNELKSRVARLGAVERRTGEEGRDDHQRAGAHRQDRKSTRLNSSHANISYAVFCLKKKKITKLTVIVIS